MNGEPIKTEHVPNVEARILDTLRADSNKVAILETEGGLDALIQALKIALSLSDVGNVPDLWREQLAGLEQLRASVFR